MAMAVCFFAPSVRAENFTPVALRCEYRMNPLDIDEAQPRLTWRVESDVRGAKQTAYQILVSSGAKLLKAGTGDLWDSAKTSSGESVNLACAGKPLASGQEYFWKVCVWGSDGKPHWSEPASWTMGLLQPDEWQADYILFRDPAPVWKDNEKLFRPAVPRATRGWPVNFHCRKHAS